MSADIPTASTVQAEFATMAAQMNAKTVDEQRREIIRQRAALAALVRTAAEVHRISDRTHNAWTALAAALDDARAVMTQRAEPTANKSAADIARLFCETYERLAPTHFGIARPDLPAFDPDSREGYLITAVFADLLANGAAETAGSPARDAEHWTLMVRQMLTQCEAYHQALDTMFARMIEKTANEKPHCFFPTESGQPWDACQSGHALIQRVRSSLKSATQPGASK